MAQNYIQHGKVMPHTLAANATTGGAVVVGELVGVALNSGTTGQKVELALDGVFSLAKATGAGTDITQGAPLYWDAANSRLSKTNGSGNHKLVGYAFAAASTSDTKCEVLLARA